MFLMFQGVWKSLVAGKQFQNKKFHILCSKMLIISLEDNTPGWQAELRHSVKNWGIQSAKIMLYYDVACT